MHDFPSTTCLLMLFLQITTPPGAFSAPLLCLLRSGPYVSQFIATNILTHFSNSAAYGGLVYIYISPWFFQYSLYMLHLSPLYLNFTTS